jgi:hypothetical protein
MAARFFAVVARGNVPLMERHPQGGLQIVPIADAHLIAAAPELLETLKKIIRIVTAGYDGHILVDALVAADALVAKAEGR